MWGKVNNVQSQLQGDRITPTHVGKSTRAALPGKTPKDHPHPCGEKQHRKGTCMEALGSPPPMWGKGHNTTCVRCPVGITPTHVGKSVLAFNSANLAGDHPHPCGEKVKFRKIVNPIIGSPPPMWGKVKRQSDGKIFRGITPTHVGKRNQCRTCPCLSEDHPHPCGEKQSRTSVQLL